MAYRPNTKKITKQNITGTHYLPKRFFWKLELILILQEISPIELHYETQYLYFSME